MAAVLYLYNQRQVCKRLALSDMTDNKIYQCTRFFQLSTTQLRQIWEKLRHNLKVICKGISQNL